MDCEVSLCLLGFLLLSFPNLSFSFEPLNPEGILSVSISLFNGDDLFSPFVSFFVISESFLSFCNGLVEALIAIKRELNDPHGVLNNWDGDSVDPCSWAMITCSSENLVIGL